MKHIILIPTYNESENVEKIISDIFLKYPELHIKVIDDNSPDGTGEIVIGLMTKYKNLSLLSRKNKEGLGKAYIHGFLETMKDNTITHIITMDADMSHNPKYLTEMIGQSEIYDMVIGSRYVDGGDTVGWEKWRKALSFFGNLYSRIITGSGIHDLTGGFNCYSIDLLKKIDLESVDSSGYAFQIELKYSLYLKNPKVKEIPIVFTNRTGGESKISNHIISEGILAPWKIITKK